MVSSKGLNWTKKTPWSVERLCPVIPPSHQPGLSSLLLPVVLLSLQWCCGNTEVLRAGPHYGPGHRDGRSMLGVLSGPAEEDQFHFSQ